MSRFLILVGCLLALSSAYAQTPNALPVRVGRYEQIRSSDGVFIVAKRGKMAVVTRNGQLLTPLAYDTIHNFREGMAVVGRGQREVNPFGKVLSDFKYGYINKAGRLVVPTEYEIVEDFSEGVGYVKPSLREDVWFDKQGNVALALGGLSHAESFQGNMAFVRFRKVGFHISPDYPGQPNPFDVRGNYVDHQGRLLIPWQYDTIAPFHPGYVRAVRKRGKWGFLDSNARVVVPLQYDDIDADSAFFWNGRRRVGIGDRYGFMDGRTGRLVIPVEFEATRPSESPLVWVRKRGRWGCLNARGDAVIPFRFADARPFDQHGLAVVRQAGRWGLVDTSGKVLTPFQYDTILAFQEGRAVAERDGWFGFIDLTGREIIPAEYEQVSPFDNGRAFAKRAGLFITLDPAGRWVAVKLQSGTLAGLSAVLVCLIAAGWFGWKRRQWLLRRSSV